jgi:hypothetical protein
VLVVNLLSPSRVDAHFSATIHSYQYNRGPVPHGFHCAPTGSQRQISLINSVVFVSVSGL